MKSPITIASNDLVKEIEMSFPKWDKYGSMILIKDYSSVLPTTSNKALQLAKAINAVTYKNKIYRMKSYKDYRVAIPNHYKKPHSFFVDLTSKLWILNKKSKINSDIHMANAFFKIHRSFKRTIYVFINKQSSDFFQRTAEMNCDVEITINFLGRPVITHNNQR